MRDRAVHRRGGRVAALVALLSLVALLGLGGLPHLSPVPGPPAAHGAAVHAAVTGPAPAPDPRPNVVLILTDDQRASSLATMPNVARLLRSRGTTYSNADVPTSLCCPSRSTILTGLYAHTSRLYGNGDVGGARYGGWPRFHALGLEKRTMGPALHAVGYRTGLIGKYLNFFGKYAPPAYEPPGWDTFTALMADHGAYYRYRLSDGSAYGSQPQDYSTDVLASRATKFISSTPAQQPLFLYFATFGPHSPYIPAPRHLGTLFGTLLPFTAATLHQPLRTMPLWMQKRGHTDQAEVDATREGQLEALRSVDDAVGSIVKSLQDAGRDQNTLFIFMSDNGYFWGEHRIIGKDTPYRQATAIPMVLRWDGHVPAGRTSNRLVLNVDVASTIARATGATMHTDGLDILGPRTRTGFVLEAMNGYHDRPAYCGYRTRNRMFVHWGTGEEELYDYRLDPQEAHNRVHWKAWAGVRKAMAAKAYAACRPFPPSFRWNGR